MSHIIAAANPARDLLSSIIRKAHRKVSKRDLCIVVEEYGQYVGAMQCDRDLINRTITENPRKTLSAALDELYSWYWQMDCIAGTQA